MNKLLDICFLGIYLCIRSVLYSPLSRRVRTRYHTAIARWKVAEYGPGLKVNGKSNFTRMTSLGTNVNVNGLSIRGMGKVRIGDNFHSGIGCIIIPQNHNFRSVTEIPYDSTYIRKGVVIEDNVWLGDGVIVMDGVRIGEGSIIQAGSVVVNSIPNCAIAGGHPAKVFSSRDVEVYNRLKAEKKFH